MPDAVEGLAVRVTLEVEFVLPVAVAVAVAADTLERATPAFLQIASTAGWISRGCQSEGRDGKGNVLAMSSVEHLDGTHAVREAVMEAAPVVHWHFVSVMVQPEGWIAAAKQVSCLRDGQRTELATRMRRRGMDGNATVVGRSSLPKRCYRGKRRASVSRLANNCAEVACGERHEGETYSTVRDTREVLGIDASERRRKSKSRKRKAHCEWSVLVLSRKRLCRGSRCQPMPLRRKGSKREMTEERARESDRNMHDKSKTPAREWAPQRFL